MNNLVMAADFGSSLARAIYNFNPSYVKPELILLGPEVVEVPQVSIENYEKYRLGKAKPEDSSWIKLEDSFLAVGFLAKREFHTSHCLNSLKIDSAIALTLAMVGAICQKKQLTNSLTLSLAIVLPWCEYKDKDKFQLVLSKALSDFVYRGESYAVELKSFLALPEGGGLFARGRSPRRNQLLTRTSEVNLAVLMVGYRNASLLLVERGQLTRGLTNNLGFAQMITKIQTLTSGQGEEVLVPAICSAKSLSEKTLGQLARSTRSDLRQLEIEELKTAIVDAKKEYVALLKNWLNQQLPAYIALDEFIIGGGTARYLKGEITAMVKPYGAQINWGQSLEKRLIQTFAEQVKSHSLASRLLDVYGLFYKMLQKPLPKLRDKEVNYAA